jgi:hypothetical protein
MMQFRPVEHAITEDGEWVTVQQVLTTTEGVCCVIPAILR